MHELVDVKRNKSKERKRFFVDPQIQTALVTRCSIYWLFCILIAANTLLCWQMVTQPGSSNTTYLVALWTNYWPVLVVSIILLPIVMRDVIRLSNRFCGPLLRMRQAMRDVVAGRHVDKITIRGSDYWQEVIHEFNTMIDTIQRERQGDVDAMETREKVQL